MAAKVRKKTRRSFVVTLDMPPGVSVGEMEGYVDEAVAMWHLQEDPDSPIFDLDSDSVRVRAVPNKRKQTK